MSRSRNTISIEDIRNSSQIFVSPLPSDEIACQYRNMKFVAAFQRMLCVLAMLGVILGPVSISTAESAMASSGGASMKGMEMPSVSGEMASMKGDMPCCPKVKQAVPGCAKDCPLALICASMILVHPPQSAGTRLAFPWTISFRVLHDASLTSSLVEPPARPPRA